MRALLAKSTISFILFAIVRRSRLAVPRLVLDWNEFLAVPYEA